MRDRIDAFRAAMIAQLGWAPSFIEVGKLKRFDHDEDCWYLCRRDGLGGAFGCFHRGIHVVWTGGAQ